MRKSDVHFRNGMPETPKVGSKVIIVDGSYMMKEAPKSVIVEFNTSGLIGVSETTKAERAWGIGRSDHVFEVLEVNKPFPTDYCKILTDTLQPANNCKIRSTVDGSIYYCSRINIQSIRNVIDF